MEIQDSALVRQNSKRCRRYVIASERETVGVLTEREERHQQCPVILHEIHRIEVLSLKDRSQSLAVGNRNGCPVLHVAAPYHGICRSGLTREEDDCRFDVVCAVDCPCPEISVHIDDATGEIKPHRCRPVCECHRGRAVSLELRVRGVGEADAVERRSRLL